jgi:transposase
LWGGISRKGLTPLIIFEGKMNSTGFQDLLKIGLIPFIDQKYPENHRLMMDQDPKHCSKSTKKFLIRNDINYFNTSPESPDLNPIEMVWNDLKYYLCTQVHPRTKADLLEGINKFWLKKKDDLNYCNKKIDHLYKVVDRCIALTGSATGL